MGESGATETVAVALRRGMRPYDSALIKLALSTIILRRRRKAKKTKRGTRKAVTFHSLPPVSSQDRPDHLCNVLSMAEHHVEVGNTSRALSLAKYAALQLSQMDADTRGSWIHEFLMKKATTKRSLALWSQIIHLSHQPEAIASDILAVALVGMNGDSYFAPYWFFLAEVCVPYAPIAHVAAAWKQLAAASSWPIVGAGTNLADHARAVLTEQLHARLVVLQEEEQCCDASQRWTGSRSELLW